MGERAIRIESEGVRLYAILAAGPAAALLWEALPILGTARLRDHLGVALETTLRFPQEPSAAAAPRPGDLLYSRGGGTILLISGAGAAGSPESAGPGAPDESWLAFGRITGDATRLLRVRDGGRLRLTALEG